MATPPPADETLDATGLKCPEPLMLVRNRIRGLARGAVLLVCATDPASERDLRQFCRFMGHTLEGYEGDGEADPPRYRFWIRKA